MPSARHGSAVEVGLVEGFQHLATVTGAVAEANDVLQFELPESVFNTRRSVSCPFSESHSALHASTSTAKASWLIRGTGRVVR